MLAARNTKIARNNAAENQPTSRPNLRSESITPLEASFGIGQSTWKIRSEPQQTDHASFKASTGDTDTSRSVNNSSQRRTTSRIGCSITNKDATSVFIEIHA